MRRVRRAPEFKLLVGDVVCVDKETLVVQVMRDEKLVESQEMDVSYIGHPGPLSERDASTIALSVVHAWATKPHFFGFHVPCIESADPCEHAYTFRFLGFVSVPLKQKEDVIEETAYCAVLPFRCKDPRKAN